jgi:hypothetical protein
MYCVDRKIVTDVIPLRYRFNSNSVQHCSKPVRSWWKYATLRALLDLFGCKSALFETLFLYQAMIWITFPCFCCQTNSSLPSSLSLSLSRTLCPLSAVHVYDFFIFSARKPLSGILRCKINILEYRESRWEKGGNESICVSTNIKRPNK